MVEKKDDVLKIYFRPRPESIYTIFEIKYDDIPALIEVLKDSSELKYPRYKPTEKNNEIKQGCEYGMDKN